MNARMQHSGHEGSSVPRISIMIKLDMTCSDV